MLEMQQPYISVVVFMIIWDEGPQYHLLLLHYYHDDCLRDLGVWAVSEPEVRTAALLFDSEKREHWDTLTYGWTNGDHAECRMRAPPTCTTSFTYSSISWKDRSFHTVEAIANLAMSNHASSLFSMHICTTWHTSYSYSPMCTWLNIPCVQCQYQVYCWVNCVWIERMSVGIM